MNDQRVLTLRPSKTSMILYFALCSIFTVVGALMIGDGRTMGWLIAVLFGLGSLVFLLQLLPNCSYLRLDPTGFTMCSLFRSHHYRWSEVEHFGITRIGLNKMVAFNFSDQFDRARIARRVATEISGYEGALPDPYGMKHEQLAELMNQWKVRCDRG